MPGVPRIGPRRPPGAQNVVYTGQHRALYLSDPWFDPDERRVDPERLLALRVRFWSALAGLELGDG